MSSVCLTICLCPVSLCISVLASFGSVSIYSSLLVPVFPPAYVSAYVSLSLSSCLCVSQYLGAQTCRVKFRAWNTGSPAVSRRHLRPDGPHRIRHVNKTTIKTSSTAFHIQCAASRGLIPQVSAAKSWINVCPAPRGDYSACTTGGRPPRQIHNAAKTITHLYKQCFEFESAPHRRHVSHRYTPKPVNAVWGNSRCLLSEPHETHRYIMQTEWERSQMLN
jgi:hypothetical protein